MITKYNNYITEKTNLSNLNLDYVFIKRFFNNSYFRVTNKNFIIIELKLDDIFNKKLDDLLKVELLDDNLIKTDFLIIKNDNAPDYSSFYQRLLFQHLNHIDYLNSNEFLLMYNTKNTNEVSVIRRPKLEFDITEKRNNHYKVDNLKYYLLKDVIVKKHKTYDFEKTLLTYFIEQKSFLFNSLLNNYENFIKNKYKITKSSEFKNELTHDISKIHIFRKNLFFYKDIKLFNCVEEFLQKNSIYDIRGNILKRNILLNEISLELFKLINKHFNIFKYINVDKELNRNDMNSIKNIDFNQFFDEEFLKKWDHIINANKFDLI